MRRWIDRAARFYSAWWRKRSSDEFAVLLDDLDPGWKDLLDILRGALFMHLTTASTYLRCAAITAAIGALAAIVISWGVPERFVSTAVIRPVSGFRGDATEILSRMSLARIILHPHLDLYPGERA